MRITIVISVRQTGHPAAISDTRMAHGSQKRACLHGTNAKPARGATRHTSQQSSEVDAADDSDAVEVVTAGTGAWLASSSLLLLFSSRGCKDSVWGPTEWLTACRNWRRRFSVNFSHNSQHFRIPTQPVILVVNGQFSDFYSAVIIRQGLFSSSVQPLFDLVLKLHGLAMSGPAMSTPAIWCRVFRSRDVHPCYMVSRCPVSRCQVSRFQRPHRSARWGAG